MSLDVSLEETTLSGVEIEVFTYNITHNLNKMASEAGIYKALWRPDEINITKAKDLIPLLEEGLESLESNPGFYREFNSPNGWGCYEDLVKFVRRYLQACRIHKEATVYAWR